VTQPSVLNRLRKSQHGKSAIVPKKRNNLLTVIVEVLPLMMEPEMLGWVVTFLIIGLIAAVLGFGGIAGASFAAAKIIFLVAILLFLIAIIFGTVGARSL
jgi:uncharacterized membrane protein YtjA (UPF0391 family)